MSVWNLSNNKISNGPRTDPCGTPCGTGYESLLSQKNLAFQFLILVNLFYYENRTSCTHRGKNEQTNKHKPKTHTNQQKNLNSRKFRKIQRNSTLAMKNWKKTKNSGKKFRSRPTPIGLQCKSSSILFYVQF